MTLPHRYRTTLRDRSQLLGTSDYNTPPSSGRSSPFAGALANGSGVGREVPFQPMGQRYADDLEGQNDEHLEGLTAKVKLLKDVSAFCFECVLSCQTPWTAPDHDWHWERSPRLYHPAQPNGVCSYAEALDRALHGTPLHRTMLSRKHRASSLALFAA